MENDEMYDYNDESFNENLTAEDVERVATRATLNTLQAISQSTVLAQQARDAALARAEEKYPGFLQLYSNTEVCKRIIEKRPVLARMILNAENGQGSDALDELYGTFVDTARVLGLASTTAPQEPSNPHTQTQMKGTQRKDDSPLATSESRQELIRSFEQRFGDVSVDLADDSEEGKRTRRY